MHTENYMVPSPVPSAKNSMIAIEDKVDRKISYDSGGCGVEEHMSNFRDKFCSYW